MEGVVEASVVVGKILAQTARSGSGSGSSEL
jgi:hypothetical protein